jgi:hypothetical protein
MLRDLRKAFAEAVNKKVLVSRGDKEALMTRVEIGLEQLPNQFAKGDRHARKDLMDYADKLGIDFLFKHRQTLDEALAPKYQAILDASFAGNGAARVAPAPQVLAPPELLDDDPAKPTIPSPGKAQTRLEPEPEPPQQPGVKNRVNAIALAPAEDFRRDSDLFAEGVQNPEVQRRFQAALKRGFQTRHAEMDLARMLGDLTDHQ